MFHLRVRGGRNLTADLLITKQFRSTKLNSPPYLTTIVSMG